ncbi:hypothetical protein I6F35_08365 [Bradyrhizobium sp. BRP22]|uniref:hypothetical protein n=1 Tax=Bradyrhizobium sp. BRP22 TaxID=2793821 RepID=UPI001CD7763C|nr:hypothetical protein [Bradyrhizobium sp. BRP22]MCA1453228.1 hypothetical protein [Bradyrhizobium sp. BRP22]
MAALFYASQYFWAAMLGAFVLYMLNKLNNRQPFSLFNAIQVPTDGRPVLTFIDMILSSGLGAGIVLLLTKANSTSEAVTGGLGLTGILSAIGKNSNEQ